MCCSLAYMSEESRNKAKLRQIMRQRLDAFGKISKKTESALILKKLSQRIPPNAICATFAGTHREPDLRELFQMRPDLTLAYPRVISPGKMTFHHTTCLSSLSPGTFGILEPAPCFPLLKPEDFNLFLCPGLAFTKNGNRLGQGGGFYDQYLAQTSNAEIFGISYSIQILPQIPTEPHDARVQTIISPKKD